MSGLSARLPAPQNSTGDTGVSASHPPASRALTHAGPSSSSSGNSGSSTSGAVVSHPTARVLPAQGNALPIPLRADGKVQYDAVVKQGLRPGQDMQTSRMDVVPLRQRPGSQSTKNAAAPGMERPSEEEVKTTTDRTRLALEKLTQAKVSSAQPHQVAKPDAGPQFIRYTPANQRGGQGTQRIIQIITVAEDPLQPSRKKQVKTPARPPSPPPPVLRSPPRKATAAELKEWDIPPVISNWKNNRGFTIPLDKRLAADGRGMEEVQVSEDFAHFSEALNTADELARQEVRQRAALQAKLAAKEKAAKEEHLRDLAQRAREGRSLASSSTPASASADGATAASAWRGSPRLTSKRPDAMGVLTGYGSGSDAGSDSDEGAASRSDTSLPRRVHDARLGSHSPPRRRRISGSASRSASRSASASASGSGSGSGSDSEEDAEARERDRLRAERRREKEREMRLSRMGTEQRARVLAKEQSRDISEKVALGLAKPSAQTGLDERLFNRESLGSWGDEDAYNLYDQPLLKGSSAARAIYSRPTQGGAGSDGFGGGTLEGIEEELGRDRFGLGQSRFQGVEAADPGREAGPVQFEKDSDPFAIGQFLDQAKRAPKRAGGEDDDLDSSTKRPRQEE